MDFRFTEEQEAFRKEVRRWLEQELTPEIREDMELLSWVRASDEGPTSRLREFNRKLGATGWLGMNWPKEYGGQERSVIDQFIVIDEIACQWAVIPNHYALTMEGPCILRHGSEEQRKEYLPRICRGEIELALGYTEPDAGSDLASLQMRAALDGADYVLNGQKTFNTSCHYADYHWLAARTDPDAAKHRGISVFIVDLKTPGITIRPLYTMAGGRTNEVYYDNVRVPMGNLVGQENRGWSYIVEALDYERIMTFLSSPLQLMVDGLVEYAKETQRDGKILAKDPIIRQKLADIAIAVEVARLLHCRALVMLDKGTIGNYEPAMLKLFVGEIAQRLTNIGMQILGPFGLLQEHSKWVSLKGRIETGYRATLMHTFGAGSSELMRNVIAMRGFGLPA